MPLHVPLQRSAGPEAEVDEKEEAARRDASKKSQEAAKLSNRHAGRAWRSKYEVRAMCLHGAAGKRRGEKVSLTPTRQSGERA